MSGTYEDKTHSGKKVVVMSMLAFIVLTVGLIAASRWFAAYMTPILQHRNQSTQDITPTSPATSAK